MSDLRTISRDGLPTRSDVHDGDLSTRCGKYGLGAGLFLSTISGTQQQAMMSSFFFFQPAFMLSGFSFPIRNMPEPIQYLTYLNPMRYFMEVVRGVFLKGSGMDVLWPQLLAMAVFGVAILTFSAMRFHKRLD